MTATADTGTLRFRHSPDVLWRATGSGVIILARTGPQVVALEGSGAALWRALSAPRSPAESAAVLSEQFGLPADDIERDIEPVIHALSEQRVLVAEIHHP